MGNVVSLTGFKLRKAWEKLSDSEAELQSKSYAETRTQPKEESEFEEIMRKNEEKTEKMRKERSEANKGVLRSYRIKR